MPKIKLRRVTKNTPFNQSKDGGTKAGELILDLVDTSKPRLKVVTADGQKYANMPVVTNSLPGSGDYSSEEGSGTMARGKYSHAEGNDTIAGINAFKIKGINDNIITIDSTSSVDFSLLMEDDKVTIIDTNSKAYIDIYTIDSTNETQKTITLKSSDKKVNNAKYLCILAKPEVGNTLYEGASSHAEGNLTRAIGKYSHAEGGGDPTRNKFNIAFGPRSHVEGYQTQAIGSASHAQGFKTQAIGNYSHAEGSQVQAIGFYSHAEGYATTASGDSSHAEGYKCQATSENTHAEGFFTEVLNRDAHTEGRYTIASGDCQHVQGEYNLEDKNSTYAHIVGNGKSKTKRSNAHTIDWNGNAWFQGDVYTGSTSGINKDEGSKKLATENYVEENVRQNVIREFRIVGTSDFDDKMSYNKRYIYTNQLTDLQISKELFLGSGENGEHQIGNEWEFIFKASNNMTLILLSDGMNILLEQQLSNPISGAWYKWNMIFLGNTSYILTIKTYNVSTAE